MRKLNKNNGITLIALVITIIVMLILVGVSISMAVNGGLFNYAGKAVGDTKNAITNENKIGNGGVTVDGNPFTSIDDYIEETKKESEDTKNYIGYYADIDGDETVDGIIYADLAFSNSGIWNPGENTTMFAEPGGSWDYSSASNLKEYVVSEEDYEGVFGTKPVIKASSTEGNDRFYVMALSDVNPGTEYCWYDAANVSDYTNYSNKFGTGKTNTHNMIKAWNETQYGAKDDNGSYKDVWGVIQKTVYGKNYSKETKTEEDVIWFLPSANEWAAFGSAFKITTENHSSPYDLKDTYQTSSLCYAHGTYYVNITGGYMNFGLLDGARAVRLSATF